MNQKVKDYWTHVQEKIEEYNSNGKPTVALFCESFYPSFDGVINVQTNYAQRLRKDFNVVMVAPRTKKEYIQKEYLTLLCKSIYWKMIHYPYALPGLDHTFKKHLKKLRIDLVHIHGPFPMGHYGVRYAKRHHIPVVGTFHTQFKQDFLRYVKIEAFTRPLVRHITRCFNKCDEVWTMNPANVEILHDYGYKGLARIMPNGTDMIPSSQHELLVQQINEDYNLKDKQNVMMFCGRMVENKNIFLIADVLDILKAKNFPFHMLYVGDGLDLEKLKKYIHDHNLDAYVTFTGKIMDRQLLGAFYKRSDLFLFPSIYDTDGIVKYEAAAFATPSLLISDSPSAVGTIDNQTAYLTTTNPTDIADKIIEIFSNPDTLNKVSNLCHQHLYKHWDTIVGDVAWAYNQLLSTKKK